MSPTTKHPTHYNTETVVEPLSKSIKRRAALLWELVTFRPRETWAEDFRWFRQRSVRFIPIEHGEPGYEDAEFQNVFVPMAYQGSFRWVNHSGVDWPDQMGGTITEDMRRPKP